MAVERAGAGSSLIDVLDRVLDKGIVIDAYVRVSLVGIDLVSVEARIVVASVETYLKFAEAIGITGFASRPLMAPPAPWRHRDGPRHGGERRAEAQAGRAELSDHVAAAPLRLDALYAELHEDLPAREPCRGLRRRAGHGPPCGRVRQRACSWRAATPVRGAVSNLPPSVPLASSEELGRGRFPARPHAPARRRARGLPGGFVPATRVPVVRRVHIPRPASRSAAGRHDHRGGRSRRRVPGRCHASCAASAPPSRGWRNSSRSRARVARASRQRDLLTTIVNCAAGSRAADGCRQRHHPREPARRAAVHRTAGRQRGPPPRDPDQQPAVQLVPDADDHRPGRVRRAS
jgi:gas vesicle structural protein